MTIYCKSQSSNVLATKSNENPKRCCFINFVKQISSWWSKFLIFHPFIRVAAQWHETDAPWPLISKVGSEVFVCCTEVTRKSKSAVLITFCNQNRSWWPKFLIFHPFVYVAIRWFHTYAPWPFIAKVGAVRSLPFLQRKVTKTENPKKFCFINFV